MNKSYRNLITWQKADQLAFRVYNVTEKWSQSEKYGLISQVRRSAVSVALNIVEATGRQSKNDTRRFLEIAIGSLRETDYLLEFCKRVELLKNEDYKELET